MGEADEMAITFDPTVARTGCPILWLRGTAVTLLVVVLAAACSNGGDEARGATIGGAPTSDPTSGETPAVPQVASGTWTDRSAFGTEAQVVALRGDELFTISDDKGLVLGDLMTGEVEQLFPVDRGFANYDRLELALPSAMAITTDGSAAVLRTEDPPDNGLTTTPERAVLVVRTRAEDGSYGPEQAVPVTDQDIAELALSANGSAFVVYDSAADSPHRAAGRAWSFDKSGKQLWTSADDPLAPRVPESDNLALSGGSSSGAARWGDRLVLWGHSVSHRDMLQPGSNQLFSTMTMTALLVLSNGHPTAEPWRTESTSESDLVPIPVGCGPDICVGTDHLVNPDTREILPLPDNVGVPEMVVGDLFVLGDPGGYQLSAVRSDGTVVWDLSGKARVTGLAIGGTNDTQYILVDPATGTEAEVIDLAKFPEGAMVADTAQGVAADGDWIVFRGDQHLWTYRR